MKQNRIKKPALAGGHEFFLSIAKELMARQNAQEMVLQALLLTLVGCLPADGRSAFLKDLYARADTYKSIDIASPAMDPQARVDAADLARMSGDHLWRIADALVEQLPSNPQGA